MAIDVPNNLSNGNGQVGKSNGNGHSSNAAVTTDTNKAVAAVAITNANVSYYPRINKQFLPIIGLFVFYIAHDALQERMFRYDGFEFGFFMTLVEVVVMLIGSIISENDGIMCTFFKNTKGKRRRHHHHLSTPVLIRIGWVGLFLALAHGLGNTSLNYSPYPLKVAFKSCKLVPTMALGACLTGRKHTALQYAAALVMGMGLAVLTAADMFSSINNKHQKVPIESLDHNNGGDDWAKEIGPFIGPILLSISTVFDSIVPNLQEQLLQTAKVKTSEMILVSNMVMCVVVVTYTIYSGELVLAWRYCTIHKDASFVLLLQGLSAYLGLRSYLAIIRDYGGVVGVLLANGRKIVTIMLSFALFAKPFNERHFVGLALVGLGVYLGYISKKGSKKDATKNNEEKGGSLLSTPNRKRRARRKKSGTDQSKSHEHNV